MGWEHLFASMVRRFQGNWLQNVVENLHEIVNKFNLQQQPWMFDLEHILKELHTMNCRISNNPSETAIIDAIYPKINGITYQHLVVAYKRLLSGDQISADDKVHIIRSIRYLVQKIKGSVHEDLSLGNHQASSIRDPRLCISHISQSIISSTPSVEDLIAQSVQYLERHNVQDHNLLEYFRSISSGGH